MPQGYLKVAKLCDPARDPKQYSTTLFHYASHIQQRLVSSWGVGKQVTIKYICIKDDFKHKIYYTESVH